MPPAHPTNPQLTRAALFVVMLGASVAPLDFALSVGFPAIADDFGLNLRQIRWVAISYVLTYGALMLWLGALGDRVGHLRVFAVGLVLSTGSITAMLRQRPRMDMPRAVPSRTVSRSCQ